MLAQQIIAVLSVAMVAVASPLEVRTSSLTGPQAAQACGNNLQAKCCNQVQKASSLGLLDILGSLLIGTGCTPIDVLNVLPINQQCNQQTVCCQSGASTNSPALVNIQNVCPKVL